VVSESKVQVEDCISNGFPSTSHTMNTHVPEMRFRGCFGLVFFFAALFLSINFGFGTQELHAQIPAADSLKRLLFSYQQQHATDSITVNYLNDIAYSTRNNIHDTALAYSQEAFRRATKIGYVRGQAKSLLVQGIVAIYEGHYNAALEMHVQSIDLYHALCDTSSEAALLNNIGYLYKTQGKNAIAKEYFQRSEALFRAINDTPGLALVLGNRGDIAMKEGDLHKALRIEKEALNYGILAEERYYTSVAFYHIGAIFLAEQAFDSALSYQRRALQMFTLDGNKTYMVRSYENLAAIFAAQKRFSEAFVEARQGLEIANSAHSSIEIVLICERLSDLYARTGRYDSALVYFRRTTSLRDSLTTQNIEQRMKVLDMMRQAEKSQKDLLVVEKEQAHLELWRNSLVGGIILVLVLLALAMNRYRFKSLSEKALREVNKVIIRQQTQIQEQSVRIQITNAELEQTNHELDGKNENLFEINTHLEAANERLAALNHEKDELLSIVAHDLKNPLTGIIMSSSALNKQAATLPEPIPNERVVVLTGRIMHSSERMLGIITKLLHSTLLDEGARMLEAQTLDISTLVRRIAEEHYAHARAKSITIHIETPLNSIIALADPDASAEIIENLIDNAVKYSPHGKRVVVRVLASAPVARFEVQDEGEGISPEDMKKMFGKFTRLSARPTGGEDSTGLGLSIVKKMVEGMNGKVWCESELGQGATFIVELPLG
jgi:signal transduction histidine kinase